MSFLRVNLFMLVATVIALTYMLYKTKLQQQGKWELRQKKIIHNKYVRYYNSMITRKRFRRIVTSYSSMSCYEVERVQEESVKLFEKAVRTAILMPVAAAFLFRDVLLTLLVCGVAYMYYDITVDRELDKTYTLIIEEASRAIQSIRERYLETSDVAMAVLNCDKGVFLVQPLSEIYQMLIAVDSEECLYQFCRKSPVRIIKTLAMICYITKERGDTKSVQSGSAFADEMTSLRQEADCEIRRLKKIKIAFKSLPVLSLVGLVAQPIMDLFLMSQIPGTAVLIKGLYGSIEKAALIVLTILAYYRISTYMRSSVVNSVDRSQMIYAVSQNRKMKRFVVDLIPKKFKIRRKLKLLMQDAISSKTMEYIYTEKVIMSIVGFIAVFVLLLGFTYTAKDYVRHSYKTLTFTATAVDSDKLTEAAVKRVYAVDDYFMSQPTMMEEAELRKYLTSHVPELSSLQVENEMNRMFGKWDRYQKLGFKWYYVLLALLGGVVGWFVPEISLTQRKKLVKFEEVEDVMQMQTMMTALSQTTMSVYEVLYWLERQTVLHKAVLSRALQEYTYQPLEALEKLKASVGTPELKRIVSKLETAVYNLPLAEAFSDMLLDKEQLMRLREMAQTEEIEQKKNSASFLAQAPIYLSLLFGFVGPIIILGFTEILRAFSRAS